VYGYSLARFDDEILKYAMTEFKAAGGGVREDMVGRVWCVLVDG